MAVIKTQPNAGKDKATIQYSYGKYADIGAEVFS